MGRKSRVQIFQRLPKCHIKQVTFQGADSEGQARWRGEVAAETGEGGGHWDQGASSAGERSGIEASLQGRNNRARGQLGRRAERGLGEAPEDSLSTTGWHCQGDKEVWRGWWCHPSGDPQTAPGQGVWSSGKSPD